MGNSKRVIITGAPGTGKSSVIGNLRDTGYHVFDEVAREIIKIEMKKGSSHLPWLDMTNFSKKVIEGQKNQYRSAQKLSFFDRGIPDILAYLRYGKLPLFKGLQEALDTFQYFKYVFILPPWKEIYVNDKERKETFEESVLIHNHLKKTYESLGYNIVEVPKTEVSERVKFITNYL